MSKVHFAFFIVNNNNNIHRHQSQAISHRIDAAGTSIGFVVSIDDADVVVIVVVLVGFESNYFDLVWFVISLEHNQCTLMN
jgi:hypothetical protein